MPRPKGYKMSPESRDLVRAAQLRNWAEQRGPTLDFTNSIVTAVRAGDAETAHAIIDRFMAEMPQDEEDQD